MKVLLLKNYICAEYYDESCDHILESIDFMSSKAEIADACKKIITDACFEESEYHYRLEDGDTNDINKCKEKYEASLNMVLKSFEIKCDLNNLPLLKLVPLCGNEDGIDIIPFEKSSNTITFYVIRTE